MTQFLPPNLLALFAPREPIPYLPPPDKLPHEKKNVHNYQGIGQFVKLAGFEDPSETPPPLKVETRDERLERKKREKEEQVAYKLEQEIALWDPTGNDESTTDPFKTLYIGRISYYTTESKIRREFEQYGTIKKIRMVQDKNTDKPRGYCFIEYEHEREMHGAYKHADGMKIDGKRVLVDVERARTVKGWLPRRLGGGLGGTRRGGTEVNVRHSGREDGSGARRSRSRDRDRSKRSSRSRERRRRRSRSKSRDRSERKRRRSRSRERSRRTRSKSRDRKRSKRSRSRERRRERGSKDRDRRNRRGEKGENGSADVRVKDEPEDGDYGYDEYGYQTEIKQEGGEDRKPIVDADYDEGQY